MDEAFLVLTAAPPPRPLPPDVEVVLVDSTSPVSDIRENLDVNERGFDPAAPPVDEAQAEAFRSDLAGGTAVTVRAAGEPVSAGMVLPLRDGVAELAGIATLTGHRRRGYGRIATEALIAAALRLGAERVVLSTGDPAALRLYRAMGFAPPRDEQS